MNAKLLFKELDVKAMPQVELEKMLNVLLLRKSKGCSQFELSFLMGQRDFYVRDAENPNHTLVYTVPFTNIFRQIFSCDTAAIVPNINRKPVYSIRILEATDEAGNSVYRAERKIDGRDWELIDTFGPEPKDLILSSEETTTTEQEVKDWVISKFAGDYFDAAKHALQILKDCEKQLNSSVRPLFLANALKACNGTKGLPKLLKTKDGNGRFVYRAEQIIELTTERLFMRPFRKSDAPLMYALNEDPEVLQYTGDVQFTDIAAATTFLANYEQYKKYKVGRLVVILKETGETLGWCGLKYHPESDEYDIGYRFFKKNWGKGYATESAKAALEYGFKTLKLDRIIGRARAENLASINVFNKLDMRLVRPYTESGENWVSYEIINNGCRNSSNRCSNH